jgi:cell pole-organizing protein PopZ
MAEGKVEQDPTMEEILQSIKRIIAEDGEGGLPEKQQEATKTPEKKSAPAVVDEEDDELELTDIVEEGASSEDGLDILSEIDSATAAAEEPIKDFSEELPKTQEEPEAQPDEEEHPEVEMIEEAAQTSVASRLEAMTDSEELHESSDSDSWEQELDETSENADSMMSAVTASAASKAFSEFIHQLPGDDEPVVVSPRGSSLKTRQGTTIEELMIEAFKPMLRTWMDHNLPSLMERIIREELQKLVPKQ